MRSSGWLAALLFVGACGSNDDASTLVRKVIGPGGGQVSSYDEVLTILIQPGALEEDVEIQISPSEMPPPSLSGLDYRVKPDIDVRIPVEVTYRGSLPMGPTITAAVGAIHREDYLNGRGSWVALPHSELNSALGLVAGTDTEIALYYGLLGVPPTGDTDTLGGTTESTTDTGTSTGTSTTTVEDATTGDASTAADSDETGGTSSSGGSNSGAESSTSGPEVVLSHAIDIQPIWDANCMGLGCHVVQGGWFPNLATDAYNALLNTNPQMATVPYVTPGEPHESYVFHKVNGTHLTAEPEGCGCNGVGGRMPLGMQPLPQETIDLIATWILQGAAP